MSYLLLITALITIGFTTLVSIPGSPYLIGGMTQADISALYPTQITPAGLTFAIWSLIYLSWMVAGVAVAFFQKKISLGSPSDMKTLSIFSLAIGLTGVWLIPWGLDMIGLSLMIMLVILSLLGYVFHRTRHMHPSLRWSVDLTLGWINIATVANISVWLVSLGYTGSGIDPVYWAIVILGFAGILTLISVLRYHAMIIGLVYVWTMLGEWIAHEDPRQRIAVIIYALIVIVALVFSLSKKR